MQKQRFAANYFFIDYNKCYKNKAPMRPKLNEQCGINIYQWNGFYINVSLD